MYIEKIANESIFEYEEYLRILSEGGLLYPTLLLLDFVTETFRILEYMSQKISDLTKSKSVRAVAEKKLGELQSKCFGETCREHKQ